MTVQGLLARMETRTVDKPRLAVGSYVDGMPQDIPSLEAFHGNDDAMKLDVLLMHEDLSAGLRGKQMIDQVAARLGEKAEFGVRLWRFDLLDEPVLRNQAMVDATGATIVILAVNTCSELPTPVCEWLKQWLQTSSLVPCAIIVSLDSKAREGAHPVLRYINAITAPSGVQLFPHYADTPATAWDWSAGRHWHADAMQWSEEVSRSRPPAAWGINE